MSSTLIATLAGLTTALCWGTSDWLAAKSTKKLGVMEISFALQIVGAGMMLVLLAFTDFDMPSLRQLLIIGIGEALVIGAYMLFVKALAHGVVGIIVPIGNSYALITVLLSFIFLAEVFSLGQVAAMLGIVAGSAILAYEKNYKKVPLRQLHKDTILAVGAALTWGVAFFVLNQVVDEVSWQELSITGQVFTVIISSILLVAIKGRGTLNSVKKTLTYKPIIITGVLGTIGALALYLGSDAANSIIIPTVLSSAGPLVASVWAAFVDSERIGALKRIGAVAVVFSIVVLNLA